MNIGVHETHCCARHGCKYGDDDCPVANRTVLQAYACEDCGELPAPRTRHELKLDPVQFAAVVDGTKRHEVRDTTDRTFAVGDLLVLREFDRAAQCYTGNTHLRVVSNITAGGSYGLPKNLCVMSIQ